MPAEHLRLPPEPSSVGAARSLLRRALSQWDLDGLEFAASQALTELATNAVIHARTPFEIAILWNGERLRVCVEDHSPRLPARRSYAVDATTGRGLGMVERLCRSWGVETFEDGKRVWFEVAPGDLSEDDAEILPMFSDDLDAFDDVAGHRASPLLRAQNLVGAA
ncbi:MAG TPA: ATP-binding protein [Mycobacteriales bacterium]|nr:ATP-binding protein [Mycobacteriales bacterium]